jgi:hypothetical protein
VEQFLAFYQKEIALYLHHSLDRPVRSFCIDCELSPLFKEAWCKKLPPSAELLATYKAQPPLPNRTLKRPPPPPAADVTALLGAADPLGRLIQYRHQGFLPNVRQQRAGGLAALELAQQMEQVVANRREGRPTWVDSGGASCSGCSGRHQFGWRDAMDIVVKWRQLSEPNDQVRPTRFIFFSALSAFHCLSCPIFSLSFHHPPPLFLPALYAIVLIKGGGMGEVVKRTVTFVSLS